MTLRRLPLLLMLLAGCGEAPRLFRVVQQVDPDGTFSTRDVELITLTSPHAVQGDAVHMWARAVLSSEGLQGLDDAQSRDETMLNPVAPSVRWVMADDVAVPRDYDSLNLLTAYAHFEEAVLFFQELGVTSAFSPAPVYYQPVVDDPYGVIPHTDNAAYLANVDGFLLLPMAILQDIPFSMNPGVLAHEYAHRVFYHEAWGGEMFAILTANLSLPTGQQTWNLLRALDEGVADYFGAMLANDPRFISHSLYEAMAESRDLSVMRELPLTWTTGLRPLGLDGNYDPYGLGSLVSSTLWSFAEISGRRQVAAAIIVAERQLHSSLVDSFQYSVGDFEARVLAALPPTDREALCERAAASYQQAWVSFASVCP